MRYPEKLAPRLRAGGYWGGPPGTGSCSSCTSLHTSQPDSFISFCCCVESCFLFALTRQKLPPFCQQGYLRMQGLVGTESFRQHRVESGALQDHAAADRHREDSGQWPGYHGPIGHPQAPGPLVQPLHSNKEEL